MDKYYTPQEAAETFNLKEKTLKDWLRAGKVKGEKVGRSWRVADSEIRTYLKLPLATSHSNVTKDLVLSQLEKIQESLLSIDEGLTHGMKKSEALDLAAYLEETIGSIDGHKYLDEIPRAGAVFQRTGEIPIEEDEKDIFGKIDDIVNELIDVNSMFNYDLANEEFNDEIKSIVGANTRKNSKLKQLLDELKEASDKFQAEGEKITLADAYKLAAKYRRIEEYLNRKELSAD